VYDHLRNVPGNVVKLIDAYQTHGHKKATVDPLRLSPGVAPELDPTLFGIDLRATSLFSFIGLIHSSKLTEGTTADLVNYLESVYCGPSAIEAKHINDEEEKQWLFTAFEKSNEDFLMFEDEKKQLARDLIRSQVFDQFLAKKFGHIKRYGAEGAESLLGFMGHLFHLAATAGVKDIVIGMPHRGRLNFLVDLLKFHPSALFHKMKGNTLVPGGSKGSGDVLSHLVNSVDLPFGDQTVHVTLVPNPSHLEASCLFAIVCSFSLMQPIYSSNKLKAC
jgi:probable 2-oxoglutarate dehydrogenase E1 component DHKTD1